MNDVDQRISGIKSYIQDLFGKEDEALKNVLKKCEESQIPMIHVPPHVGKLIYILTKLKNPKNVLEIGTLGGYSTIWIAKALNEKAKLTSIEINEEHVKLAKSNANLAGFDQKITFLNGEALPLLETMRNSAQDKFDMVFVDADKENYLNYFQILKEMIEDGALILSDNLIPKWKPIGQPHPKDQMAKSIYAFNEALSQDEDFETAIATTLVGTVPRIDGLGVSLYQAKS